MERKRPHPADDLDPDYEDVADQQNKRQRQLERDAKLVTTKKIEAIIRQQFAQELQHKESEVDLIDQRLHKARLKLDRLRACLVASYYNKVTQPSSEKKPGQEQPVTIHPAVKGLLGKAPLDPTRRHQADLSVTPPTATDARALPGIREEKGKTGTSKEKEIHTSPVPRKSQEDEPDPMCSWECGGRGRFKEKRRIIIGNVSRYILTEKRDAGDRATHKWMVYVRGSKDRPDVSSFIKKVWFFLHPSYSPNDLVEVSQEPFHLIRRGWGEFPVRVQLHFLDPRNKRVDIIHHLKLDKTYTGLQTLGAETVVDLELEGGSSYPAPSTSRQFPPGGRKQTSATTTSLPGASADDDTVVEASCVVVKREVSSDSDMDAVTSTVTSVSGSNVSPCTSQMTLDYNPTDGSISSSPQVIVKREPVSPVKETAQRNGFVAQTSQQITPPVDACDIMTGHATVKIETPVMPSSGDIEYQVSSDICVIQPVKTEPEDVRMLIDQNHEPHSIMDVGSDTPSLMNDMTAMTYQTVASDTPDVSLSTQGGHFNSLLGTVEPEIDQCLPQENITFAVTCNTNDSSSVTVGDTSTVCVGDVSSVSVNDMSTVCVGDVSSASVNDMSSVCVNDMSSASVNDMSTVCVNDMSSVCVNDMSSVCVNDMSSASVNNMSSVCISDVSSISINNTSPVSVGDTSLINSDTSKVQRKTHIVVQPRCNAHDSNSRSLLISQNAVGSPQLPGQSILRPQLVTKRTASPDQQFVRVIDQTGRTYLIPRAAADAATGSGVKATDPGTVVVVKKPSIRQPIVITPRSTASIASPHQVVDRPVAAETATSVLTPGVSSFSGAVAKQWHSYSMPAHTYTPPTGSPFGGVSLLKSRITTPGVPCTLYQNVANSAALAKMMSTSKTLFNTVASANERQHSFSPASLATPGGPITSQTKLYLAKVGNRTVMIKVEPKCEIQGSTTDLYRDPGGENLQPNRVMLQPPGGRGNNNEPHSVKEKVSTKQDGKDTDDDSWKITRFVQSICLVDYNNIEELIRAAMTHFPLWRQPLTGVTSGVSPGVTPSNTDSTCTDILQWNIGKQRAAEWLRSRLVRRAVMAALDGQTEFKGQPLWTTREVMMWCRYHGYTPLDKATQRTLHRVSRRNVGPRKCDSYTHCRDLQPLIDGASLTTNVDEPDIDVEDVEGKPGKSSSPAPPVTRVVSSETVAPSAEVKFIQQMAQQIGVQFGPVELTPGQPQCTYAGVTEVTVWTAVKTFAEHLLRAAVCSCYKREPLEDNEVTVTDVFDALTRTDCFDFLTNRYMAVTTEDPSLSVTATAVTRDMT